MLEEVRTAREQTTSQIHEEVQRNYELRRRREISRLEAQMKGLPPPGIDIKMLERINNKSIRQLRNSLKSANINLHAVEERIESRAVGALSSLEKKEAAPAPYSRPKHVPQVQDNWKGTNEARSRMTSEDKKEAFFGTLAEVLLDRSADQLSPHLAAAPTTWSAEVVDGFHPRNHFRPRLTKKDGKNKKGERDN